MQLSKYMNIFEKLISKDSKPLLLFVRMAGAGLFFLASLLITNNFDISIVSDFEFANSLLLLGGSLVLFGTDVSILQISGKLLNEDRISEIRSIVIKVLALIFSIASLLFVVIYSITQMRFYESLHISVSNSLLYKVIACFAFYATSLFIAESFRSFKGNLLTELYHGIFKYLLFFVGVIFLYFSNNYSLLVNLYLGSFVIVALFAVGHFLFLTRNMKAPSVYGFKELIKVSFPMSVSSLSFFLLLTTDVILLKLFGLDESVSIYAQPLKIVAILIRIKVTLEASASTDIAKTYFSKDFKKLRGSVFNINRWVALFCVPSIIVLFVFASQILSVFGGQYVTGTNAFYILLIAVSINVISGCTGSYMNMTGKQVALQYILMIAAAINILTNILLIPIYGIVGAAIASLIAVLFWNAAAVIYIWRKDRILLILR